MLPRLACMGGSDVAPVPSGIPATSAKLADASPNFAHVSNSCCSSLTSPNDTSQCRFALLGSHRESRKARSEDVALANRRTKHACLGEVATRREDPVVVKGVHLITRHSVFMAAGLFGLVHLIPNGFASDIAFFAGFPVFALIGCIHQDQRKLVTDSERYADFHAATPLIPFTGKNTLQGLKGISPLGYALGIGAAIALRYFHAQWFG